MLLERPGKDIGHQRPVPWGYGDSDAQRHHQGHATSISHHSRPLAGTRKIPRPPKTAFFHHEHSYVSLLRIDGKQVRKVPQAYVGALAAGSLQIRRANF